MILGDQGKGEEAGTAFRRALELKPDWPVPHTNYVYCEQFRPGVTLADLASIHADWDHRHAVPFRTAWKPHDNIRDPKRQVRLGFVSGDFWQHALAYIFVGVLEGLNPQECETVCYSNAVRQDDMTGRIKAAANSWREVHGMSDEALAQQIRADGVDILFDLDGHTSANRLLVFARKPAPIQVTWLGYVGTTGLSAMDYLIADRWEVPEGMETYYREKVLRLPDGYLCYDPPTYSPDVGALPAKERGYVTFGSFNKPQKINPSVVALWAAILRQIPRARLVLKYRGFGDPGTRRHYEAMFASHGIECNRLEIKGASPHGELLGEYNRIDLALDPCTFSGGVTTCEALWMGVPVLTCPGETFASRHSLSHLSNIGLTETVAQDLSHYVELAVELAHDLPRLARWRAELRERMAASPLCNSKRFAENLMQVLRGVWQEWCRREPAK
jgi:predicted O-linked N-acetylglucosamine transferase (SPINDLY family)